MLVVNVPYAVFNDGGVAIAKFVILVYKVLLISLISFGGIFLRFKECRQLAGLVCLGEGTLCEQSALNLRVAQVLVALNDNLAHLHLLLLVNLDVKYHLILSRYVVALAYVYLSILITLVVEIVFGQQLSTVYHVRRNLVALKKSELCLKVLTFRLLHTYIING